MPYFDGFDICEAHFLVECHYNVGGWLHERPSNRRRKEATACQLKRLWFIPASGLSYDTLSDNGREIYDALVERYQLPKE